MRRIILSCVFLALLSYQAEAFWPFGRKNAKKVETVQTESPKKKSAYEKFLSKKGLKSSHGDISIYLDKNDVYLEIPDSLLGRSFSVGSYIKESSDLNLSPNSDISGRCRTLVYSRTDSLAVFSLPDAAVVSIDSALSLPRTKGRIQFCFPIKYHSSDSSSCVFKATDLFNVSDDRIARLYASTFNGSQIYSATKIDELSNFSGVMSFPGSAVVVQDATFDLALTGRYFGNDSRLTAKIVTSLCLARRESLPYREADSRIGVRTRQVTCFDSRRGTSVKDIACRWDLSDKEGITVYVDTILPAPWRNAIRDGIEAWNPAFRRIGLGDVVKVLPFPKDSSFSTFDPRISTVLFSNTFVRDLSARFRIDNTTGEIYGFTITVPGEYLDGVRYASSYVIGDVDSRYTEYNLCSDAVCDVLRAQVMRLFGKCLGLDDNFAGSLAYTPEELRSPEFTSAHGITASVMDKVLFNYLARPGDKERGVVTVVDRIGPYDYHAIEWLYGNFSDKAALDSLVSSRQGDKECLYVPASLAGTDPRVCEYDLGSDPFEAFKSVMSHLKYAADNADKWLAHSYVPDAQFRELYVENMWMHMARSASILSRYVGGLFVADARAGDDTQRFTPVPKDFQRKAVKMVMDTFTDISWLDNNRTLMHMAGVYSSFQPFTTINAVGFGGVFPRIVNVERTGRLAGSDYSVSEFLDDFQMIVLKNVGKGIIGPREDDMVNIFIQRLISFSPSLRPRLLEFTKGASASQDLRQDATDLAIDMSGIPAEDMDALVLVVADRLRKVRKDLSAGRGLAKDDYARGRITYLINMIDYVLDGRK